MTRGSGFSIASVFLSYLMIAGGISAALLGLTYVELEPKMAEIAFFAAFGAGAFLGGFFAARASRGSTVAEPAVGAVLLVGTICALLLVFAPSPFASLIGLAVHQNLSGVVPRVTWTSYVAGLLFWGIGTGLAFAFGAWVYGRLVRSVAAA